jgi:uncharacterized membrane protein YhaH (DUF805 family)
MARNIGALFAGLVAGLVALIVLVVIIGEAFPVAARINPSDPNQIKAAFAGLALHVKLLIVLAWFLGPLAGALAARRIGTASWPMWSFVILFALYVGLTISVLPMPGWMQAGAVAAPLIAGLVAHHYGPRPRRDAGDEPQQDVPDADA